MGAVNGKAAAWMQAHFHGQNVASLQIRVNELIDEKKMLLETIQHLTTQHRGNFDAIKQQRKLISHFKSCLKLWMPRGLEKHDRTVSEMRDVQEKIARELDG